MKKLIFPFISLFLLLLACGQQEELDNTSGVK